MATILIVDDRPANREYLLTLLGYGGHRLLEAGDGAEALAVARGEHPDLIISDILMPTMDGYEFARRLRSEAAVAKTPVIFCTATYHEGEAQALAAACGVAHVLRKPCIPETLLRVVDQSLGLHAPPAAPVRKENFEQEHLRLLTNKLASMVGELELQYEQLKHANQLLEQEVAQRKRAEKEVQDSAVLLRVLSRRLMSAQESERRSIARELHDEIGQALSTLRLNLHVLQGTRLPEERSSCINDSVGLVERTLQQVRDLSLNLRPSILDDLGLASALEWQLDRLAARAGFQAHVSAEGLPGRLPAELETTCFRIAQEALTNIVRHAQARRVTVAMRQYEGQLVLTVRDDGVGFDVEAAAARARDGGSMGLLGMQERVLLGGGELRLRSVPGRGTEIRVRFPLADAEPVAGSNRRSGLA